MFINTKFILASESKSRYKILKNNNLCFVKKKPLCDEESIKKQLKKEKKTPKEIVKILAKEKAKSISKKHPKQIVVGCDTIILFDKKIINKAKNLKMAKEKILKLSGKKHKILSAACVCFNNKLIWSRSQSTTVEIRRLKKTEINDYINACGKEILGSAGCYQIELLGPTIIKKIKGDFFNVMGFPLFPFLNFLKKFKIKK